MLLSHIHTILWQHQLTYSAPTIISTPCEASCITFQPPLRINAIPLIGEN